ncbi:hypothetical protein [Pontibacter anaerobius]|uniref:GTPase n=1 Tax=Pontibacter anaerobius TaxID=2993940 RepID=A0ABT3RFP4_9BACT|nr:hypothetical protein [Pontibacter anaerobius]MCX2740326.1 hypothetical protein [Pontibacter anaerobius]
MAPTLLFVYNAETGFFNKLVDFTHKIVSPKTYPCSLCSLTYGNFTAFPEWESYVKQLPLEVRFVYKNEWPHGQVYNKFPLVALQGEEVEILLTKEALDKMTSLEELIDSLNAVLPRTTV